VRNVSVLNVRTSDYENMGYNLKQDDWLNSFTDVKNQSMRDDRVPWRGAREKRPEFFSILFSALTDKDDIIFDWQCGVGSNLTFLSSHALVLLYSNLFHILFISRVFPLSSPIGIVLF
jgi:hypothetical protein